MDITGVYRHFKGNYYRLIGPAVDTDTGEGYVLYRQMYAPFEYWIRPRAMFFGCRDTENGPVRRFTRVGISFEPVPGAEDLSDARLLHSETLQPYRCTRIIAQDGTAVYEVTRIL